MLNRRITQAEFGDLVGISQPAVSDLAKRGVLKPDGSAAAWLLAYCERLREEAAGRAGRLAESRAALDDERRIEIAMRNAIKRREYVPVVVIEQVLAKVGRQIAGIFDGFVPAIRLRWPEVTSDQLRLIEAELARARNLAATMSPDVLVEPDEAPE